MSVKILGQKKTNKTPRDSNLPQNETAKLR